jgi:replication factor A2
LQVLAFFTQNDNHDDDGTGLALDYVANGLRAEGISEKDVRAAVDFLANEGHLYSTIDDNHYKSTA